MENENFDCSFQDVLRKIYLLKGFLNYLLFATTISSELWFHKSLFIQYHTLKIPKFEQNLLPIEFIMSYSK